MGMIRRRGVCPRVRRAAGLALCAGLLANAPTGVAIAAPPAAQSDLSKQAQQLFEEGMGAAKLSQWEKSRTFLLSAWRLQHHWRIAANLGRAELKLGRMRDAAEHLSYFLREAPAIEPEDRRQAEEMLARARARVGAVRVTVSPAEAEVWVDGEPVGKGPFGEALFLEPGTHRIEARGDRFVTAEETVVVGAGREVPVGLRLVEAPRAIEVRKGGGARGSGEGKGGPNKAVVIAGATAGAVALGLGVGFMAGSFAKAAERDNLQQPQSCKGAQHNDCPRTVVEADKARASLANASFYGFIGAGVIGAATLTYVLVTRSQAGKAKTNAAIVLGPGGAFAMVTVPW